jgi:hypothetical protein
MRSARSVAGFEARGLGAGGWGSRVIAITGALAVGAPASGTLRVDFTVNTSSVLCTARLVPDLERDAARVTRNRRGQNP